jgi:hypothetical protein
VTVYTRENFQQPAREVYALTLDSVEVDQELIDEQRKDKPPLREWAQRIPTAKGTRLDFERFPFQPEIYDVFGDVDVKDADVMKGIQAGLSELITRLMLYMADIHGLTGMHVFPALRQMYDFSTTRINTLRETSEYVQSRTRLGNAMDWPWNKGLKRMGSGYCYYRGSESRNDLIAVDADLVCLDEYDSLDPRNVPEAERRVGGSLYGLLRRVGVPTDPEHGIARRFAQSDMREWHTACPSCGEWQTVEFDKNVDAAQERLVCHRCRKPLDVADGEWVKKHPERERPGFHVHRLLVPGDTPLSRRRISEIVEASKRREPINVAAFWRNDLGLPYADVIGGLDRTAIAAAISAAESFYDRPLFQEHAYDGTNIVTAGIDVASVRNLNVRISEHVDPLTAVNPRKRALFVGEVEDFNELVRVLNRFQVRFAVIDHMPDSRLSYGLAERMPGRVWVVHYSSQQLQAIVLDTANRRVSVQRVPAMDATIEILRAQRNLLPEDLPEDYVDHMVANRRKADRDQYGRQRVYYDNGTRPDDYFQAEVYDVVATEVAIIRMEAEQIEAVQGQLTTLDQELEFERSRVADYDEMEYRPGPRFGGYSPGPRDPFGE